MKVSKTTEPTETTKTIFNTLRGRYGIGLKITDLLMYLRYLTGLEILDHTWTSEFESYLIDQQRKFMSGDDIDMTVLHQDVVNVFHLTKLEKQLLVDKHIEEMLWAILLAITFPSIKTLNNND